ncbi:MAG TPA: autotransporter domain-containing protein, partial [Alcaligenes sp.]|nr:autotransporter domain-containing protein [Alcaligenes sp.]HRL27449.1 autotransporter domain-containing protein [Alcaligenes sp.]
KQKYPWMSNDNLRTTLLTTASDIGAPGVDELFGWGRLDAAKAMNGPAQLAFGDMRADVTPGHYVFSNPISGAGGLIKQGAGTLELTGRNSYSGATQIEQGELRVSGTLRSAVRVGPAGILGGQGSTGSVINQGTVRSHGAGLTVQGDYSQGAAAVLDAQWGSVLAVRGKAELDGTLRLSGQRVGFVGQAGQWIPVLTAAQVQGRFSQIQDQGSVLLSQDVLYRPGGVDLHYQARPASGLMAARADGPAADIVLRSAQSFDAVVAGLSAPSDDIGSTASVQQARQATGRIQHMTRSGQDLADVLYSLSGATYANALALAARQYRAHGELFMNQLAVPVGMDALSFRVWAAQSRHDARWRPQELDGRLKADDTQIGISHRLDNRWTLGAALGRQSMRWSEALTAQSQTQSSTVRSESLMAGAAWQNEQGWRVQGALGYQHLRQQARRWVGTGQDGEAARGDGRGRAWSISASAARRWSLGTSWSVTPSLGLGWQHVRQNALQEEGGVFSLALGPVARSLWTARAGVKTVYDFQSLGRPARLSAAVTYERDLGGNAFAYQASYQGVPGQRFEQQGVALGRDRINTQLRVDWQIGARTDLGLGVQTHHGKDWNSMDLGVQLGVRF